MTNKASRTTVDFLNGLKKTVPDWQEKFIDICILRNGNLNKKDREYIFNKLLDDPNLITQYESNNNIGIPQGNSLSQNNSK